MGAKKDKKSKAADKKARTAQKQEKKASKSEKKQKAKGKGGAGAYDDDSDGDDNVDVDQLLKEYAQKQEAFLKVTETVCGPPSPRSSAALLGSPAKAHELLLFGGEHYNGANARFHNELFVYNTARDEWRLVTSPNSPLPRSGHAWTRAGNTPDVYLFAGEFSSPKQKIFYHYNDFWRLDPVAREWTKVETRGKKGPPARSGHRMTYFKNYIVLFGGFQDTAQSTKYLNDLWLYDCQTFTWHQPALPPASPKPDPRSSFSFLPHDSGAVLYGGYSRVKTVPGSGAGGANQKRGKAAAASSSSSSSRAILKPVIHQDTFFLRITPPPAGAGPDAAPKVVWERRKRAANQPSPTRAGATMAHHKGRGILFGGVHDVEESEEGIESEFFNQLFAWNVDRNRFFPLTLRRPRAGGAAAAGGRKAAGQGGGGGGGGGRRGRGKADEENLLRNLAALEMKGKVGGGGDLDGHDEGGAAAAAMASGLPGAEGDEDDEDEDTARKEKPVTFEMPHPRFNTLLAVQNDVLYTFSGTFEKGDREYTFDEMWSIDLGKLDGVREIFRRELEDWQGSEDEEDEDDDEDEEMDDDEDEDDDDEEEQGSGHDSGDERAVSPYTDATSISPMPISPTVTDQQRSKLSGDAEIAAKEDEEEQEGGESSLEDSLPHPRPFESLREFFDRTKVQWQEIVMAALARDPASSGDAKTVKEVRKDAFAHAEEKWWDCREEIRALEDEQEAAGIGEVVSLGDKAGGGPGAGPTAGPGRRR